MLIILWLSTALFALVGTWLVLFRSHKTRPLQPCSRSPLPGVSILKPLCGADQGLRDNIESFFQLSYPDFELIFSVNDPFDPSVRIVEELQKKYPTVHSWLVKGGEKVGPNPKVNNLVRSYELCSHDLVLISDSNVRVAKNYLLHMVPELEPDVGVVTAIVAGIAPIGFGGQLEASYLNTFYTRGMKLAFATGNPCVIGKSMLFRRCVAARFGGIRPLGAFLAEDYALGEEMRKLGLRVALAREPVKQFIGKYSFQEFWRRHIRWGRIRKAHAPFAFLLEPMYSPVLSSVLAGFAFSAYGLQTEAMALNFAAWMVCDLLLLRKQSGSISLLMPAAWLAREILALPLWLAVASGNTVNWRGNLLSLGLGGKIIGGLSEGKECSIQDSFGERLPLHTRWRAITRPATGGTGSRTAM